MGKSILACFVVISTFAIVGRTQDLLLPMMMMPIPMEGYVYRTPMTSFELPSMPTPVAMEEEKFFQPAYPPRTAICVLRTAEGVMPEISGGVFVTQEMENGPIVIFGTIQGLTPGKHGFHLHRDPIQGNNCAAAGPHFNPFNKTHGGPDDENRHAGDFGNIEANELGVAFVSIHVPGDMVAVESGGMLGIIGRSIVIHEKEDDLGQGKSEDSLNTGGAGARQACCQLMNLPKELSEK